MEALSLHHTRWLVRPKIWAANWAAASGERIVEQPRPARVKRDVSENENPTYDLTRHSIIQ